MEKLQAFGGVQTQQIDVEKMSETDGSINSDVTTALGLSKHNATTATAAYRALGLQAAEMEAEEGMLLQHHHHHHNHHHQQSSKHQIYPLVPLFTAVSSSVSSSNATIDDLHRLVNYQQPTNDHHHQQQQYYNEHQHHHQTQQHYTPLPPPPEAQQQLGLNTLPNSLPTAFSDRLWEWNPIPEGNREYPNPFK